MRHQSLTASVQAVGAGGIPLFTVNKGNEEYRALRGFGSIHAGLAASDRCKTLLGRVLICLNCHFPGGRATRGSGSALLPRARFSVTREAEDCCVLAIGAMS